MLKSLESTLPINVQVMAQSESNIFNYKCSSLPRYRILLSIPKTHLILRSILINWISCMARILGIFVTGV